MQMAHKITISQAGFVAAAFAVSMVPVSAAAAPASGGMEFSRSDLASLREASAWASLRANIRRWKDLPTGWDGDDGVAPSGKVLESARAFVDALEAACAPLPADTVAGDGEVAYEWASGARYASASFTDDGHFIGYIDDGEGDPLRVDEPARYGTTQTFLTRIAAFA